LHRKSSLLEALLIMGMTLPGQRALYDFVANCLHKNIRNVMLPGKVAGSLPVGVIGIFH
jgi:hypothetical protein